MSRGGGTGVLRNLASRLSLRWVAAGLAALIVAVSGLFGGLRPTEKPTLPVIGMNAEFQAGPWTITVNRVFTRDSLEPRVKTQQPGDRWVAVRVHMEITADQTWNLFDEVLRLRGVDGLRDEKPSEFYLVRDDSLLVRTLQPGLPEDVTLLWEQDGSKPPPEVVDIELWGMTYRQSVLTDLMEWLDREPRALILDVPVEDQ